MAIKEIKREWSPCQLDYVKTFLLHSEKDVKDLPKCCVGSKATVSETDNEYYCTADGWKLGSELGGGGSSEVVILPETEVAAITESPITTAPSAVPEVGAVCKVTYNGTTYDCPTVAIPVGMDLTGVLFGNSDAMGIPGGNATAPFVIMLFDTPVDDGSGNPAYGMLVPMEEIAEGTSITLSIVQVGAASGGESAGGIFEVSVPVTKYTSGSGHDFGEFDKSFAELVAAQKAGKIVRINVNWNNEGITYGNVIGYAQTGGLEVVYISMPQSFTMAKQTAAYVLSAGENGEIVAERLSAD